MRTPALLFLVAALACGTPSGQRTGTSLQPAADRTGTVEDPMLACVDGVVTTSRLFRDVIKGRSSAESRQYGLPLRNPPSPYAASLGFSAYSSRDGTKGFAVEFNWPGPWNAAGGGPPGGMQPRANPGVTEGQGEMVRDVAMTFLRDVRAECAPNMPGEPACFRVKQGQGGRCSLGGK